MVKKIVFIMLAMFGFSSVAEMDHMDHMADMAGSGEESDFSGSYWLKYKAMGSKKATDSKEEKISATQNLTYRARFGWNGDVNEAVQWGFGVSTPTDHQSFNSPALQGIQLEQAWVSWMPVDGVSVTAGKKEAWKVNFNKVGILYDEDLYQEGVSIMYHFSSGDMKVFATVSADELSEDYKGPLEAGTTVKVKVGSSMPIVDGLIGTIFVCAMNDGLLKEAGIAATTLAKVGVNVSASNIQVPVGAFAFYISDVESIETFNSFSAGVYVGEAGSVGPGEMGDFGVAVNFYSVDKDDHNTDFVNTDYVSKGGSPRGVAVRAQYNLWNNVNFVGKFAHDLKAKSKKEANQVVAELNFNF